jgi:hypothetical protein
MMSWQVLLKIFALESIGVGFVQLSRTYFSPLLPTSFETNKNNYLFAKATLTTTHLQ